MKQQFKLKRDSYKNARGSYSRLLELNCRKCGSVVCLYQKDGPGNLRRLYFDRIFAPKEIVDLQKRPLGQVKILNCNNCKEILGIPYVYPKENRKAFRLFQDAIIKKIKKIN